mmetsp:Transcript_30215/g.39828  ORF Transcript_30215/g.39828 Transcript_30215/m.39828 type:complete len:416 (-) Transcript_30215:46-1293(-)
MADISTNILYSLNDSSKQKILSGHRFRCFDSHIDPSGKFLATASEDGTVCIWRLQTGEQVASLLEYTSTEILRVHWAPLVSGSATQYFCFGCADGSVHLLNYQEESPWILTEVGVLEHGDSQIYHCQFVIGESCWQNNVQEEGKEDGERKRTAEEEQLKTTGDVPAPVHTASPKIQMQVVTACDNLVYVWDVHSLEKLASWQYPKVGENSIGGPRNPNNISYVFGMGICSDRVAVALSDGTVRVNETAGSNALAILSMKGKTLITSVAWSPNGQYLLSCAGNGTIFVWNSSNWDNCCILVGHTGPVYGALFLTENKLISWSSDCTLRFWDIALVSDPSVQANKCVSPFHTQQCKGFPIYNCAIDTQQNYLALVGGGNSDSDDCVCVPCNHEDNHSIIHTIILDITGGQDDGSVTR